MYEGEQVFKTVRFTIYDYLKSTNRGISGRDYLRTIEALERLKGTTITIFFENKNECIARGFGLIEEWSVIDEKDGRMVRVEVTLPDWLFNSVTKKKVLALSADYFRLRKPLNRRIYELARKHFGHQKEFKIGLELLRKKQVPHHPFAISKSLLNHSLPATSFLTTLSSLMIKKTWLFLPTAIRNHCLKDSLMA